jgi:hypothetical protein
VEGERGDSFAPQSNDRRAPTELAQHSAYSGNSHRRSGAASHIFDGLAISLAYPSGEEGRLL